MYNELNSTSNETIIIEKSYLSLVQEFVRLI